MFYVISLASVVFSLVSSLFSRVPPLFPRVSSLFSRVSSLFSLLSLLCALLLSLVFSVFSPLFSLLSPLPDVSSLLSLTSSRFLISLTLLAVFFSPRTVASPLDPAWADTPKGLKMLANFKHLVQYMASAPDENVRGLAVGLTACQAKLFLPYHPLPIANCRGNVSLHV